MPNQLSNSSDFINKLSKKLNIQILDEMIYLEIISKSKKEILFILENFENFEHVSELIKEEIEEIKIEKQIFENKNLLRKNTCRPFDSVYRNYFWIICRLKNYYFIGFFKNSKSISQIQRNFLKLEEFFENFDLKSKPNEKKIIKKCLEKIIYKNKMIHNLEKNFENNIELSSIEIKHEKMLDIPLNIEDEYNFFLQKDEKKLIFNKKIFKFLAFLFIICTVFVLFYFYGINLMTKINIDSEVIDVNVGDQTVNQKSIHI